MTFQKSGRQAAASLVILLLAGCASVTHNNAQSIQVETKLASGELLEGANCSLRNTEQTYEVTTPGAVEIERSGNDLEVACQHPDYPDAKATAVSRPNAGMYGNIILGGVIGAVIDHNTGKAYNYPDWLQLTMGQILRFDRAEDIQGQPSIGLVVGKTSTHDETQEPQSQARVSMDDLKDLMPAASE